MNTWRIRIGKQGQATPNPRPKLAHNSMDLIHRVPLVRQPADRGSMSPPVMIGPWGGRGGTPRDIRKGHGNQPRQLESITIRSTDSYGGRINGFSFVYIDQKGQSIPVGIWGSPSKGYEDTITLGYGEYINYITGTADAGGVTSLIFATNTGVEYGPYGNPSGTPFSVPLQQGNGEVLGFFGRGGDCLVALGVYVTTRNAYA